MNKDKNMNILDISINFWNENTAAMIGIIVTIIIAIIPFIVYQIKKAKNKNLINNLTQKNINDLKQYIQYFKKADSLEEILTNNINESVENVNFITEIFNQKINLSSLKKSLKNYEGNIENSLEKYNFYLTNKTKNQLLKNISNITQAVYLLEQLDNNIVFEHYLRRDIKAINEDVQNIKEFKKILIKLVNE
ncbi:hypothetical protein ACWEXP_00515 [Staphylococcus pseudoxylosus]|uniref:hypothetical protein n=1 Tax=Staphylococcus pseudoxylosus TaxID=2282419 RepID=UPI003F56B2BC